MILSLSTLWGTGKHVPFSFPIPHVTCQLFVVARDSGSFIFLHFLEWHVHWPMLELLWWLGINNQGPDPSDFLRERCLANIWSCPTCHQGPSAQLPLNQFPSPAEKLGRVVLNLFPFIAPHCIPKSHLASSVFFQPAFNPQCRSS